MEVPKSSSEMKRLTYAWSDGVFTFSIVRSKDAQTRAPMYEGRYRRV